VGGKGPKKALKGKKRSVAKTPDCGRLDTETIEKSEEKRNINNHLKKKRNQKQKEGGGERVKKTKPPYLGWG